MNFEGNNLDLNKIAAKDGSKKNEMKYS